MVNLEWYRTFKAIYQHGTLTKAAGELMISQPNVSIHLASLENYIGHPLFLRLPRKMEPTEYGKLLYTQIVESVDNLERVESEFKKSAIQKEPTITFGMPSEMFSLYLSQNMDMLRPKLIVEYGLADEILTKLRNSTLDIGFITKLDDMPDSLTYEYLCTEKFMIVCNADMDTDLLEQYFKEGELKKAEKWLKAQKWYAYNSSLPLIRRFWKTNFLKRPLLKPKAIIPDNLDILRTISSSEGFAVMSDRIANEFIGSGKVKVVWHGIVPATNKLYLVYNKVNIESQLVNQVRDFVRHSMKL